MRKDCNGSTVAQRPVLSGNFGGSYGGGEI